MRAIFLRYRVVLSLRYIWDNYSYWLLFVLCVVTRLVSAIYYVEDPDSLHFALAASDYDISKFQPHFPGYPIFCFVLQGFTLLLGKFSLAFALIGGISTFVIIDSAARISKIAFPWVNQTVVYILIFFNPFLWLMANRYMPDLMSTAVLMYAFWLFVRDRKNDKLLFQFTAGILAGLRLSVMPFLLVPSIILLVKKDERGLQILVGILGVLVWFIPMLLDTGWQQLIESAQFQAEGHFYKWGGTVYESSSYWQRFVALVESIWAHGLGGYWSDRGLVTIVIGIGILLGLSCFIPAFKLAEDKRIIKVIGVSILVYLLWVFFFQNIIHKPRHILQVIPFFLMLIAVGYTYLGLTKVRQWAFTLFAVATIWLSFNLVLQHKKPSAIAQAKELLEECNGSTLISIALVNEFMQKQGVEAEFLSIETDEGRIKQVIENRGPYYVIGEFEVITEKPDSSHTFYHNPYVNKMWPSIVVNEFKGGKGE